MTSRSNHGRAFTLIELVLVVVIFAIAAGFLVPRLIARDRREAERSADAIRELLTAAAQRELLTGRGVALDFDREAGVIQVLTPRPQESGAWRSDVVLRPDPLIPAVDLAPLEITSAWNDGASLSPDRWRLMLSGLDRRPEIVLVVSDVRTGMIWRIVLATDGGAATMSRTDDPGEFAYARDTVDLDRAGLREAPW